MWLSSSSLALASLQMMRNSDGDDDDGSETRHEVAIPVHL
jgi:hypothetical protein